MRFHRKIEIANIPFKVSSLGLKSSERWNSAKYFFPSVVDMEKYEVIFKIFNLFDYRAYILSNLFLAESASTLVIYLQNKKMLRLKDSNFPLT